jgi:hypothetical protein
METFISLNQFPCGMRMTTLNIPKEEQDHYKFVGDCLMYDPPASMEP